MALIEQITAPEVGLIYTTNNIQLKIGAKVVGKGKIFISQGALAWQPDTMPEGISIQWKQISVHGISSNPSKCIYFMLDHKLVWRGVYDETEARAGGAAAAVAVVNGAGGDGAAEVLPMVQQGAAAAAGLDGDEDEGNATDEEDEDEEEQITEFWLMPDDPNTVDIMFQAMTECQALHPDSADSISEESDFMDDDGGEDDDAIGGLGREADVGEEEVAGAAAAANGDAAADAAQGVQNLNLNDRFADAEE